MTEHKFSLTEMIEECRKELWFRREVFRKAVSAGKMMQSQADRRIAVMQAIHDKLVGERDGHQREAGR